MANQSFLSQFSTTPLYNTKAVAQETGVPADTFRAWERRYGVPHPERTEGGHRLYSERDIAIIRWLRDRTGEGMTISQAIALLSSGAESNLGWLSTAVDREPRSWERLNTQLLSALIDYDATRADKVMSEAFAIYPLEDVLLRLVQPAMIEIGERWHRGELAVTTEHFATQFVRRKLSSLLNTYDIAEGRGMIVMGCSPSEQHEIGAMMIALFLVRHGWQVIYLGPEVPKSDLIETVRKLQPDMVCMSASTTETALELIELGHAIEALAPPRPHFAYGGRAFIQNAVIGESMPGIYLGTTPHEAIETVAELLAGSR
jgi:MerR family transcriptional regulator, light-induced transcriptional regulator